MTSSSTSPDVFEMRIFADELPEYRCTFVRLSCTTRNSVVSASAGKRGRSPSTSTSSLMALRFWKPSAVHWYAEGFQKRSAIKLEVEVDGDLPRLPADAETTLFRVVQESLTNVHRYSGSSSAKIRISKSSGEVLLEVIDYGHGIKSGTARAKLDGQAPLGVGIPGMRERLHQLGGELIVDFGTSGTRVAATLPIRKSADGESDESLS